MTLGWIGNLLILLALYFIGCKHQIGWLFSIVGNSIWCWYAIRLGMLDVLFIDGLSLILAAYNWYKWRDYAIH